MGAPRLTLRIWRSDEPPPTGVLAPETPEQPGAPCYHCAACDAVVLAGTPISQVAARRDRITVKCPSCGALLHSQVTATSGDRAGGAAVLGRQSGTGSVRLPEFARY